MDFQTMELHVLSALQHADFNAIMLEPTPAINRLLNALF
jgi:hypothetical protein